MTNENDVRKEWIAFREKFKADAAALFSRIITLTQSLEVKVNKLKEDLQSREISHTTDVQNLDGRLTALERKYRPALKGNTEHLKETALLKAMIDTYFNRDELISLAADMDVDYDNLAADGKAGKARELVEYCERRNYLGRLANRCQELRPKVLDFPMLFDEADWK